MNVKLDEVVFKISGNEDRFNTELQYYLGGEHYEEERIAIYNKGIIRDNLGVLGFKFHFPFKSGDTIFMSRNPHLKKAGMVTYDGICSDTSYILRTKNNEILYEKYLPLVIQNDRFWMWFEENKSGSVNYLLNWKALKEYSFFLPSIQKQMQVADTVWAIEETCQAYLNLLAQTEDLIRSKYTEMFKGENTWEKRPLKELFNLQMGKTPPRAEKRLWQTSDHKWVSIADMSTYGKYTTDTKEYLSDLAIKETGIKVVPKDTVIMSFKLTIGRTAITSEDIFTNEAIMAFIPKTQDFDIDYLRLALSYHNWSEGMQNAVKGATLNKQIIGDTLFAIPPLELQKQFATLAEHCENSKTTIQRSLSDAYELQKKIIFESTEEE